MISSCRGERAIQAMAGLLQSVFTFNWGDSGEFDGQDFWDEFVDAMAPRALWID